MAFRSTAGSSVRYIVCAGTVTVSVHALDALKTTTDEHAAIDSHRVTRSLTPRLISWHPEQTITRWLYVGDCATAFLKPQLPTVYHRTALTRK
ncbi:MAG: hypothetical protein J07HN4v3_02872 [Halonotius sp. J07HN4]|nr:MAG: hypothetical protein J07HN4v3_02872 [Halonotius sp. J07HN4]